jgi:hypothetical protein
VRGAEYVAHIGLKRHGYRVLRIVTLLGNPRRTCEDIIKINLKQNGILGFTWLGRGTGSGQL